MSNKKTVLIGFIFSVALAVGSIILGMQLFDNPRITAATAFHAGVDVMGTFLCAVLFYGCYSSRGEQYTSSFSLLVLMTGLSFAVNELMWFVVGEPQWHRILFVFCLVSKCLNLAMIYCFYLYVRGSLQFKGKLARAAEWAVPGLLILSVLLVLANVLGPVTFSVDDGGNYGWTGLVWLENLYLIITSAVTAVLIFRSDSPYSQKWAAMSFILIPILEFVVTGGAFAYSIQYGAVLLALVLMYCLIFNDRSRKLASTQTELTMATQIQESMIPSIFPAFPERQEIDLYASMDPAREVGGDFYDFFLIDDDHLGMIIADVSGKGIPAALYMMISKTILQNFAKMGNSPAEVLEKANESLCAESRTEMFVTTWVGILELSTGKMTCANAGHEYPVVCRNGQFDLMKDKHGFVLGGMEGMKYRDYEIRLEKGDKIFVYTDGVPEATNAEQVLFGTDRMVETLNRNAEASPVEILRSMRRAVDAFVGSAEQFDDLTMLCLEYRGMPQENS